MQKSNVSASRWVGLAEVAEVLGISKEAARRLVHRGTLPHRRIRPDGWSGNAKIEVPEAALMALQWDPAYLLRRRGGRS